jgi:hypothetical protein
MKYLPMIGMGALICWLSTAGPLFAEPTADHIEVIVGGKKYESMEGYREDKVSQTEEAPSAAKSVSDGSDDDIRRMFSEAAHAAKNPLSLKFDPAKMKTIYVKAPAPAAAPTVPASSKDPFARSYTLLNRVGFDHGVHSVISDFMLTQKTGPLQVVKTDDLEQVLRHSFGGSNAPLLLISDHNTLRIMTLDNGKDPAKTGNDH